jgi:hypothetical protein
MMTPKEKIDILLQQHNGSFVIIPETREEAVILDELLFAIKKKKVNGKSPGYWYDYGQPIVYMYANSMCTYASKTHSNKYVVYAKEILPVPEINNRYEIF